jgi:hypothetical protein
MNEEQLVGYEGRGNDYGATLSEAPLMGNSSNENKIRPIQIDQLNRGYVVRVGCHSFAIADAPELIAYLTTYISDPNKTEKNWFAGKLF